ncbi:transcription factor bHLH68-like isoform X2 [Silene latifolia]|uniref:transcription factor bHLH68-like isoform X2 n=1 Tax=Silene latifolia TaxID=37657 RepID=UPI003D76A5D2
MEIKRNERMSIQSGVYVEEEGKKMEMWEEQVSGLQHHHSLVDHMKQESSVNSYNNHNTNNHYNNNNNVYSIYNDQEFQLEAKSTNWSPHQINIPASSPQSCVSTVFSAGNNNNNNNMVDFSSKCSSDNLHNTRSNPVPVLDNSFESNSTSSGGILKKQKVEPSSSQSTFKARKEKVGDRITTLHQLVSPFGKSDTASVLLESFGYIRFLQSQIEALSVPYLTSGAANKCQQHTAMKVRKGVFPEDRGQLLHEKLHEKCWKRKGGPNQDSYEEAKDLRSRGLCLVPLSCTMHVGSDNGADYWAPAIGGGSGFQ